jgi:Cytochrome c oxidase subunit IIa family
MPGNFPACGSLFYGLAFGRFRTMHMSNRRDSSEPSHIDNRREDFDHPRGTLAIVAVFGSLFILAWLATYLFVFLQRGAPH